MGKETRAAGLCLASRLFQRMVLLTQRHKGAKKNLGVSASLCEKAIFVPLRNGYMNENEIGKIVVDAAVHLHMELGPGLLEGVYETLLAHRLQQAGLKVTRQVPVTFEFDGIRFDEGFRADLIVEDKVILELKSVETIHPAHKKQVLTYLKLTGLKLGYLLNFGAAAMKDGIHRIVNGKIE